MKRGENAAEQHVLQPDGAVTETELTGPMGVLASAGPIPTLVRAGMEALVQN